MKKFNIQYFNTFIISLVLIFPIFSAQGQQKNIERDEDGLPLGCTSIMVGKKASTDGSVITCHTCDGGYRAWLNLIPHKIHKEGSMHKIYWGTLFTESLYDSTKLTYKGSIPEVAETFSYLNTAYPCMNEKQLAMGETTISGKKELVNTKGLFLIEELQKIALERCSTAREAIKLMGSLAEKYGYADWGECLTVADKKEVWHFEIFGAGKDTVSAVWAAIRIPDDHIAISANISRIGEIKQDNPNYMTSKNVFEIARKYNWWDGKETFKFWKAYGTGKPFAIREFFVFNTVAPSLKLKFDTTELPFSVKPDKKISIREVMSLYRQTYEGTIYDMTQNLKYIRKTKNEAGIETIDTLKSPIANPWMSSNLRDMINYIKPGTIERQRNIAVPQTAYSTVIQLRDWLPDAIGGITWFSFDNSAESPRIPIFGGNLELPESFKFCYQYRHNNLAAGWAFREANKLATLRWQETRTIIENGVMEYEDKAFDELIYIEKKANELYISKEKGKKDEKYREYLTSYTNTFALSTMGRWKEYTDKFWNMFSKGF